MTWSFRIQSLLAIAAVALVGCMQSGLTQDQAQRIALQEAGPSGHIVSAHEGPLRGFIDPTTVPSEDPDTRVWAVVVFGSFPISCPPPSPCPLAESTELVIIDRNSGHVLFAKLPA
jgi:hypothetical protein